MHSLIGNAPWLKSKKVNLQHGLTSLELTIEEEDYHEFRIVYDNIELRINCFLSKKVNTLVLMDIDIEGPGAAVLGKRIFSLKKDVSTELCKIYDTKCVELHGARRTTGKTKGKIPLPDIICLD